MHDAPEDCSVSLSSPGADSKAHSHVQHYPPLMSRAAGPGCFSICGMWRLSKNLAHCCQLLFSYCFAASAQTQGPERKVRPSSCEYSSGFVASKNFSFLCISFSSDTGPFSNHPGANYCQGALVLDLKPTRTLTVILQAMFAAAGYILLHTHRAG